MSKKCYRFYGGLLASQEKWLNQMAAAGYRLIHTTKAMYEFKPCRPGQYQYRVEFVGQKSKERGAEYARFLEDCGYQVFFKNINWNYSIGKLKWRPWAEKGGRLATNATTYNRELLIVAKENDGNVFELHTTCEDKLQYCQTMGKPWLFLFLVFLVLGVATRQLVGGIFAAIALVGLIAYRIEVRRLKKDATTSE